MNSLKPVFTMFHAAVGLKRLLVAALAVLLLGVFTALPALASGSGTWTLTGSLNVGRANHTATLLSKGQVLVAGGLFDDYGYDVPTRSAELYTPSTGKWTNTGGMNVPRAFHVAARLSDGRVLVAGGRDPYNRNQATAELYDPATGTWAYTGSLNTGRSSFTATLLSNGQVLVAGGSNSAGHLASAELYTPATGSWTLTGSMNVAHSEHTATLLSNGQVLVAGGLPNSGAELYNPTTGSWTTTGNLNQGRYDHTATLLSNGKVLAAGGYGGCGPCSSAELYTP